MNDNATHEPPVIPPTSLPCPDWCGLPAGHGFEADVDGAVLRFHELRFGHIDYVSGTTCNAHVAAVCVVAEEHAITDQGPAALVGDPYIYTPELDSLDLVAARALIEALAQAVELVERVAQ
jgi:hypothetical protein